jgi:hypothetical protein
MITFELFSKAMDEASRRETCLLALCPLGRGALLGHHLFQGLFVELLARFLPLGKSFSLGPLSATQQWLIVNACFSTSLKNSKAWVTYAHGQYSLVHNTPLRPIDQLNATIRKSSYQVDDAFSTRIVVGHLFECSMKFVAPRLDKPHPLC